MFINRIKIFLILLFFVVPNVISAQNKTVFAHYMAWYQSRFDPAHSGWGTTWSMNGHNPDEIDYLHGTLKRDISAKNYPLQGPYDSRDFKVLEYHILLAQTSGIKGFVVDYFGTNHVNGDYPITKQGIECLSTNVEYLNKLNNYSVYSDFKICLSYDEQSLNSYSSSYATFASNDLEYIKNNYAKNSYYYTNRDTGKPFLMIWQYWNYLNNCQWLSLLNKFTKFFTVESR